MSSNLTTNFLAYNNLNSKNIVIAVMIDGLDTVLSSAPIYTAANYGDTNLYYGKTDLVYGGLDATSGVKTILQINESDLSIQQKIEPEQGRSSVSLMTLNFIDLDGYMTQVISPGILIDEILGKDVKVYVGFQQLSFPSEYLLAFRGRVSNVTSFAGAVELQLSDPNLVRRQQVFYQANTTALTSIAALDTVIQVASVADFTSQILGPDGNYDPAITTYIKIDDEIIEYPAGGIDSVNNLFSGCIRGARNTTPAAHDPGATITACLEIQDYSLDMALKIMLSGWQGPFVEDLDILNFVTSTDPDVSNQPQGIFLPEEIDAVVEYGIAVGDYLTITDSAIPGNNGQCIVVAFLDTETASNNVILTNKVFTAEADSDAIYSVRSQYDTYPDNCGLQMPGWEVDVAQHQYLKNTFLGSGENTLRFFITEPQNSAKDFIETQIYLTTTCYSLTNFGRLSVQFTHPPVGDEETIFVTPANIVQPQGMKIARGITTRKFFNQIQWNYDYDDAGNATTVVNAFDSDSLNIIGVSQLLPISAEGLRSDITSTNTIGNLTKYLLTRYKRGAAILYVKTNFTIGIQINAGDIIAVDDQGVLQISNFLTGIRNLGTQLFEVVDNTLSLSDCMCSLTLVAYVGAFIDDRYATFSPSTILGAGTDSTHLYLTTSFNNPASGFEYFKWQDFLGERGLVHTADYSMSSTCNLVSLDAANPNIINVTGLTATPASGWILDVDSYPLNTNPLDQELIKLNFCSWDPQVIASSGISASSFQVAASATSLFTVGLPVLVHNADFSISSVEQNVSNVDTGTNTITVGGSLGFTPSAGNYVELIGFRDGGQPYRFVV
jgi:hypothetical protein